MTFSFSGIVPLNSRKAIVEAKKYFENIYIIAQAEWVEERVEVPAYRDPIAVGFLAGHAWVITSFDLTSLEESILVSSSQKVNN